jgi:hypothetical protein
MKGGPVSSAAVAAVAASGKTADKVARKDEVCLTDAAVGSAEHLQTAFLRAATAAEQAVGLWLARNSKHSIGHDASPAEPAGTGDDLRALRALARAAATAYVRRLKTEGLEPERMLVLVKAATTGHGSPGYGARELSDDIVRWSIEAYFDE